MCIRDSGPGKPDRGEAHPDQGVQHLGRPLSVQGQRQTAALALGPWGGPPAPVVVGVKPEP
eukprot:5394234-Lingulodinium_polyedra.AAC.1